MNVMVNSSSIHPFDPAPRVAGGLEVVPSCPRVEAGPHRGQAHQSNWIFCFEMEKKRKAGKEQFLSSATKTHLTWLYSTCTEMENWNWYEMIMWGKPSIPLPNNFSTATQQPQHRRDAPSASMEHLITANGNELSHVRPGNESCSDLNISVYTFFSCIIYFIPLSLMLCLLMSEWATAALHLWMYKPAGNSFAQSGH